MNVPSLWMFRIRVMVLGAMFAVSGCSEQGPEVAQASAAGGASGSMLPNEVVRVCVLARPTRFSIYVNRHPYVVRKQGSYSFCRRTYGVEFSDRLEALSGQLTTLGPGGTDIISRSRASSIWTRPSLERYALFFGNTPSLVEPMAIVVDVQAGLTGTHSFVVFGATMSGGALTKEQNQVLDAFFDVVNKQVATWCSGQ